MAHDGGHREGETGGAAGAQRGGNLMTNLERPNETIRHYSDFPVHPHGLRGGGRQDGPNGDDKDSDGDS